MYYILCLLRCIYLYLKNILITLCVLLFFTAIVWIYSRCQKVLEYGTALNAYRNGNYRSALEAFSSIRKFRDSADYCTDCIYQLALADFRAGNYASAISALEKLGDYEQARSYLEKCSELIGGIEAGRSLGSRPGEQL